MRKFSFFEIEKSHETDILKVFSEHVEFEGEKVTIDISKPEPVKKITRDVINKGKRSYKKGKKKKHIREYKF